MVGAELSFSFFFFNDTATTEIYTLSLHDALPISRGRGVAGGGGGAAPHGWAAGGAGRLPRGLVRPALLRVRVRRRGHGAPRQAQRGRVGRAAHARPDGPEHGGGGVQSDAAGRLGRLRCGVVRERRGRHHPAHGRLRVRCSVARCAASRRALHVRPGSGRDGLVPSQLPRGTEVLRGRPRVVLHRSRARARRAPRRPVARRGGLRVRAREPQDESGWDRRDRRADSANAGAPGAGDRLLGGRYSSVKYASSQATSEISLQRRHSISANRSESGTRSRQFGHTAYSPTPGNRAGFLGRGTTDQRRGGAVEISSADRGTLTRSPMTSTTASGGRSRRTSYQAPRRSGQSRSARNRAQ